MPTDITWPTAWQRKVWFGAVTALSIAVIVALIVLVGTLVVRGLAFLQPLLIPVVTAVILTYLLQPIVTKFCAWGMNKTMAVVLLLFLLLGGVTGIVIWVAPSISNQAVEFGKALPDHTARGEKLLLSSLEWVRSLRQRFDPPAAADAERTIRNEVWAVAGGYIQEMTDWLQRKLPDLVSAGGVFLRQSVGGVLGFAGVVVSLLLVPIFLFFFLKDSAGLARDWRQYIPLPDSPLKEEVASLVEEINNYLVRYFRGQFMVSLIDGALIGAALMIMGLNFALLIGLGVGILAMIPYLGIIICWVPAVLIAATQFGDWYHPLIVTLIFLAMNNIEGFFIAPRIVGESVSLSPLTVILSVLIWSLVLGGLLGALLAVPLTATIKVLLQRYVWHQRI